MIAVLPIWLVSLWLVLFAAAPARAQALTEIATEHYRLQCAGSAEERAETGRFLEAAFAGFADFLGEQPGREALPLKVVLFPSAGEWSQGLAHRGAVPPPQVQSCWFRQEDGVVYAHAQQQPSLTRNFLLYVAWQQFHYFAESKHEDLVYCWFVEGVGDYLAQHRWDGQKLELGIHPLITTRDLPNEALRAFDSSLLGYERYSDAVLQPAPAAWALCTFLLTGPEPSYRNRFRKLALGDRGSKLTGEDLARSLGDADEIARELEAWLQEQQVPFEVHRGEWEDLGQKTIRGQALPAWAYATLKETVSRFEFEVDAEEARTTRAALLIEWQDLSNNVSVFWTGKEVRVERHSGGHIELLAERGVEHNGSLSFSVQRGRTSSAIVVNGRWIHDVEGTHSRFGLGMRSGNAHFRAVEWR